MSRFPGHGFELRVAVTLLLGIIGLALVLVLGPAESLTWAAPGQDPHIQTMPTRPSTPAPEATQPVSEDDDDDDDGEGPPPPPPVEETPTPAPPPVEELPSPVTSPVPQETSTPTSTPSLGSTKSALPSATAPASQTGRESEVSTETPGDAKADSTLPSSPLPTPTPASPSPSVSPTLTSTATPSSPPPPSTAGPEPTPETGSISDQRGTPTWLCALGLGVILLVGGIILSKRS